MSSEDVKYFTRAEVAKNNTKDKNLFIIHNNVYDVTAFLNEVSVGVCVCVSVYILVGNNHRFAYLLEPRSDRRLPNTSSIRVQNMTINMEDRNIKTIRNMVKNNNNKYAVCLLVVSFGRGKSLENM